MLKTYIKLFLILTPTFFWKTEFNLFLLLLFSLLFIYIHFVDPLSAMLNSRHEASIRVHRIGLNKASFKYVIMHN